VTDTTGLERLQPQQAAGAATFEGAPGRTAAVRIPAGTVLVAPGGDRFLTTAPAELQASELTVTVAIGAESAGTVRVGDRLTMPRPIPEIRQVICKSPVGAPAARGLSKAETDDQLRARAKNYLKSVSGATLAAIRRAVADAGGQVTDLTDPSDPDHPTPPGVFRIRVAAPPEKLGAVRGAVEATRAAGVKAEFGRGGLGAPGPAPRPPGRTASTPPAPGLWRPGRSGPGRRRG
jgi:hypothetical protein